MQMLEAFLFFNDCSSCWSFDFKYYVQANFRIFMSKAVNTANHNQANSDKKEEPVELTLQEKLFSETARITWHELQRFFAQGVVLHVDESLDLIDVAVFMASDNANELQPLIEKGLVAAPTNDAARVWYEQNTELWSVVVAPYVLVQNK